MADHPDHTAADGPGGTPGVSRLDLDASFTVDGVEFVLGLKPESTAERFYLVKTPEMVERFRSFFGAITGANVFELGIREGGSTAWIALEAEPAKLIAIELDPDRIAGLDDLIAARGLGEVVRPYWGVDQADATRLRAIVAAELGEELLDVVIDDASHLLTPTRASFEALFPLVRPGGLYLIEDWNARHLFHDALGRHLADTAAEDYETRHDAIRDRILSQPDSTVTRRPEEEPLSRLAIELILVRASSGDAIEEVTVTDYWIVVRRGPAALDPATFRLRDRYIDHFGLDPSSSRPD